MSSKTKSDMTEKKNVRNAVVNVNQNEGASGSTLSTEDMSLQKRNESHEKDVNSDKKKNVGMQLRSNKRKKEDFSKVLMHQKKGKSSVNTNIETVSNSEINDMSEGQELQSAFVVSNSENNYNSNDFCVPNVNDNNIEASTSTSITSLEKRLNQLPLSSERSEEQIVLPDSKIQTCNEGTDACKEDTLNSNNCNQGEFEEELKCSVCSEIFINAVTLNCSHSFCKYCITVWRLNQTTCPICRQDINSQNATLVLDKCVERIIKNCDDETKDRRKEMIEYREKNMPSNSPTAVHPNSNINATNYDSPDDLNSDYDDILDEYYDDDYHDEVDYDDEDDYHDEDFIVDEDEYFDHGVNFVDDYDAADGVYENYESNDYNDVADEEYNYESNDIEDDVIDFDVDENSDSNDYDEAGEEEEVGDENQEEEAEMEGEEEEEDSNNEDCDEEEERSDGEYSCDDTDDYSEEEDDSYHDDGLKCFNCRQKGHVARNCPSAIPYNGIPGSYYGGYGSCFKCKRKGHWKNGCPN